MKANEIKMIRPDEAVVFDGSKPEDPELMMLGFVVGWARDGDLAIVMLYDRISTEADNDLVVVPSSDVERGVKLKFQEGGVAGLTLMSPSREDLD